MDDLLNHAQQLANQAPTPIIQPIEGRVAYLVNQGRGTANDSTQQLAQALNQQGLETLCMVRPGWPWDAEGQGSDLITPETAINGVRYLRSTLPSSASGCARATLEATVEKLIKLLRVYRPMTVLAETAGVGLAAWIAAKRLDLPFYSEFKETTSDAKSELSMFVAKQAKKVFTLNQSMKNELVKRGVNADDITLVPSAVSQLSNIKSANPTLKKKLGIAEDEKVIGYVGSFNAREGLDVLLESCSQLVEKSEKLKLLLVQDEQPLTNKNESGTSTVDLAKPDKPWLIQVGCVPHEERADYYALMDAVMIPRKPLAMCKLMPPMNAAEALAYGKRLIVSDLDPLAVQAQKYDGVMSFEDGSAVSLTQTLQESLKLPEPKPSAELLFSVHTASMVKALKGEKSVSVEKVAVEPLAKLQAQKKAPTKADAVILAKKTAAEPKAKAQTKPDQKPSIKLTRDVTWQRFDLHGDNVIRILGNVSIKNGRDKAGVLLVELFDKHGKKVSPDEVDLPKSEVFGGSFMYLQDTKDKKSQLTFIDTARDIAYVRIGFTLFEATDKTVIEVAQLEAKATKFPPKVVTASHTAEKPKQAFDYKVAIIADEFTSNSFAGEFQSFPLEPDNWLDVFQDHQPDIFFCESAWAGPDPVKRPWRGKIYASINFPNENRKTLLSILEYCKKAGIPTVFWNKEDPTHHNDRVHDFVKTASLFDYVFTTAAECVESYKKNYGVKNAFALPFGTNPRLFNPVETVKRSDHVVFAGSWYENHTERCKEMKNILDRLVEGGFKLDIYNRYHGDSDPLHIWPEKYSAYLLPAKPHHEMPGVYKSSVYGLNFNTVTSSSTMFARRVFELMSSNTLVVSNHSQGVDEMFGNLVVFPDRDPERLKSLTQDEVDSIRHKALHEVLEKHTYKQRWRSILQAVGLPFVENDMTLTFTYVVKERQEALSAISWYQQYGMQFPGSRLLLVAGISMDPLDVAKFYQEFNRFGVSVTSMLQAEKYAIPDRYRPVETSHFVALRPGQSADARQIKKGTLHLQYMTEHLVALAERPNQRHKTAPATADAIVMGSASQFADWMQRQTKQSLSTVYWV